MNVRNYRHDIISRFGDIRSRLMPIYDRINEDNYKKANKNYFKLTQLSPH